MSGNDPQPFELRSHGEHRPDLEPHLQAVADSACRTLGADRASCYLMDEWETITAVYTTGATASQQTFIDGAIGRGPESLPAIAAFIERPGLTVIADASTTPGPLAEACIALGGGAVIAGALREPTQTGTSDSPAGALILSFAEPRAFDDGDRKLALGIMRLAAAAVATAKRNSALAGESQRTARLAREQASLLRVAELAASGTEIADLANSITGEIAEVFGASQVIVAALDQSSGDLMRAGGWPSAPEPDAPPLDDETVREAIRGEEPTFRSPAGSPLARAVAPVYVDQSLWGVLVADGLSEELRDGSEISLVPFAKMFGLAFADAGIRRQLAVQASCDPLTGLANHRTFREKLGEQALAAELQGAPLSLAILDIDNFKEINDRWGHGTGDRVLVELSQVLAANVRGGEHIARYGGEEFAWLMSGTDRMGAAIAAERMRSAIAATEFTSIGRLSVSIGIADLEQSGSASRLFDHADEALYWVKANGKDGIFVYSPEVLDDPDSRQRRVAAGQARDLLVSFARTIDARDPAVGDHSGRVGEMSATLATALGWDPDRVLMIREAGRVHDIGKACVPEAILFKSTRLDEAEMELVRSHAVHGAQLVRDVLDEEQVRWVRGHHERWDGKGYPDRLVGDEIPEGARILALADAWDTMTHDRIYASALSVGEAAAECRRASSTQFWPEVVAVLMEILDHDPASSEVSASAADAN